MILSADWVAIATKLNTSCCGFTQYRTLALVISCILTCLDQLLFMFSVLGCDVGIICALACVQ